MNDLCAAARLASIADDDRSCRAKAPPKGLCLDVVRREAVEGESTTTAGASVQIQFLRNERAGLAVQYLVACTH